LTTLLKRLIERLRALPEEQQDKYAAMYLNELEADQRWETLFDETTDEQWQALVEEARRNVEDEESVPLDQVLTDQES
jgi:hypothetical protein